MWDDLIPALADMKVGRWPLRNLNIDDFPKEPRESSPEGSDESPSVRSVRREFLGAVARRGGRRRGRGRDVGGRRSCGRRDVSRCRRRCGRRRGGRYGRGGSGRAVGLPGARVVSRRLAHVPVPRRSGGRRLARLRVPGGSVGAYGIVGGEGRRGWVGWLRVGTGQADVGGDGRRIRCAEQGRSQDQGEEKRRGDRACAGCVLPADSQSGHTRSRSGGPGLSPARAGEARPRGVGAAIVARRFG